MNVALWVVQSLLALAFAGSGAIKASWSKSRLLATGQTGVAPFPPVVIRLTAVSEVFAAVGLIAPRASGIAPMLTPAAAAGLCVVMVGALISHTSLLRADRAAGRGSRELRNVVTNLVLLALCLFVVAGRV